MKMRSILFLSIIFLPIQVNAQTLLEAMKEYQKSFPKKSNTVKSIKPEVEIKESKSISNERCEENDQTSLPLAYLLGLSQQQDAELEINSDPRSGKLTLVARDSIANCASMLEWKKVEKKQDGKITYVIKAGFKVPATCKSDKSCTYRIAKMEKGIPKFYEMEFSPTLEGFDKCLIESGAFVKGAPNREGIYTDNLKATFDDVDKTGNVVYSSHGPASPIIGARFSDWLDVDKCDYYERISANGLQIVSAEDAEFAEKQKKAEEYKKCGQYSLISDFLEKNQEFSDQLENIRDDLILTAAKKSAKAIDDGKYTNEDLKVMADFNKYIVQRKIDKAKGLYYEIEELEGDEQKAKQEELKTTLGENKALNSKPYFTSAHVKKLINDGNFDEAESMNTMKLMLDSHQRLGFKENGSVISPDVAMMRVLNGQKQFSNSLVAEKERYEIVTGQMTGQSAYYYGLVKQMKNNSERLTKNYTVAIQSLYAEIQPNGYCYRYYFRNSQKCVQENLEDIQINQNRLTHFLKVNAERAAEYEAKAKEYEKMEAEGRRYIAAQNGEEVPAEAPAGNSTDPVVKRTDRADGVFEYNPQNLTQMPQPQSYPQQSQFPTNPYANQNMFQPGQQPSFMPQQQSPYMGQQAYNFNWNAGAQYGQQGQPQGYWGQPYSAYNMYSMYGR